MSKSTQPSKGRIISVVHRNNTTRGAHLRLRGGNREIGSCHFPLLIFHQTPPTPDDKIHTSQQVKQVLLTLTRVSLTSSSLQERTPVWKWHKPTLQAEPSGREIHARGELFAHWDPALPAPQIYSYSIIYFLVAFSWFLLFAKGGKCSITKIRLEAPTDPERRAKSQCSRLVQVKTQSTQQGAQGKLRRGQRMAIRVWMLGSEGDQDPCRRDWAKSKAGQLPVRWPGYQKPTMHGCKAPKVTLFREPWRPKDNSHFQRKWSVPTLKLRIKTT